MFRRSETTKQQVDENKKAGDEKNGATGENVPNQQDDNDDDDDEEQEMKHYDYASPPSSPQSSPPRRQATTTEPPMQQQERRESGFFQLFSPPQVKRKTASLADEKRRQSLMVQQFVEEGVPKPSSRWGSLIIDEPSIEAMKGLKIADLLEREASIEELDEISSSEDESKAKMLLSQVEERSIDASIDTEVSGDIGVERAKNERQSSFFGLGGLFQDKSDESSSSKKLLSEDEEDNGIGNDQHSNPEPLEAELKPTLRDGNSATEETLKEELPAPTTTEVQPSLFGFLGFQPQPLTANEDLQKKSSDLVIFEQDAQQNEDIDEDDDVEDDATPDPEETVPTAGDEPKQQSFFDFLLSPTKEEKEKEPALAEDRNTLKEDLHDEKPDDTGGHEEELTFDKAEPSNKKHDIMLEDADPSNSQSSVFGFFGGTPSSAEGVEEAATPSASPLELEMQRQQELLIQLLGEDEIKAQHQAQQELIRAAAATKDELHFVKTTEASGDESEPLPEADDDNSNIERSRSIFDGFGNLFGPKNMDESEGGEAEAEAAMVENDQQEKAVSETEELPTGIVEQGPSDARNSMFGGLGAIFNPDRSNTTAPVELTILEGKVDDTDSSKAEAEEGIQEIGDDVAIVESREILEGEDNRQESGEIPPVDEARPSVFQNLGSFFDRQPTSPKDNGNHEEWESSLEPLSDESGERDRSSTEASVPSPPRPEPSTPKSDQRAVQDEFHDDSYMSPLDLEKKKHHRLLMDKLGLDEDDMKRQQQEQENLIRQSVYKNHFARQSTYHAPPMLDAKYLDYDSSDNSSSAEGEEPSLPMRMENDDTEDVKLGDSDAGFQIAGENNDDLSEPSNDGAQDASAAEAVSNAASDGLSIFENLIQALSPIPASSDTPKKLALDLDVQRELQIQPWDEDGNGASGSVAEGVDLPSPTKESCDEMEANMVQPPSPIDPPIVDGSEKDTHVDNSANDVEVAPTQALLSSSDGADLSSSTPNSEATTNTSKRGSPQVEAEEDQHESNTNTLHPSNSQGLPAASVEQTKEITKLSVDTGVMGGRQDTIAGAAKNDEVAIEFSAGAREGRAAKSKGKMRPSFLTSKAKASLLELEKERQQRLLIEQLNLDENDLKRGQYEQEELIRQSVYQNHLGGGNDEKMSKSNLDKPPIGMIRPFSEILFEHDAENSDEEAVNDDNNYEEVDSSVLLWWRERQRDKHGFPDISEEQRISKKDLPSRLSGLESLFDAGNREPSPKDETENSSSEQEKQSQSFTSQRKELDLKNESEDRLEKEDQRTCEESVKQIQDNKTDRIQESRASRDFETPKSDLVGVASKAAPDAFAAQPIDVPEFSNDVGNLAVDSAERAEMGHLPEASFLETAGRFEFGDAERASTESASKDSPAEGVGDEKRLDALNNLEHASNRARTEDFKAETPAENTHSEDATSDADIPAQQDVAIDVERASNDLAAMQSTAENFASAEEPTATTDFDALDVFDLAISTDVAAESSAGRSNTAAEPRAKNNRSTMKDGNDDAERACTEYVMTEPPGEDRLPDNEILDQEDVTIETERIIPEYPNIQANADTIDAAAQWLVDIDERKIKAGGDTEHSRTQEVAAEMILSPDSDGVGVEENACGAVADRAEGEDMVAHSPEAVPREDKELNLHDDAVDDAPRSSSENVAVQLVAENTNDGEESKTSTCDGAEEKISCDIPTHDDVGKDFGNDAKPASAYGVVNETPAEDPYTADERIVDTAIGCLNHAVETAEFSATEDFTTEFSPDEIYAVGETRAHTMLTTLHHVGDDANHATVEQDSAEQVPVQPLVEKIDMADEQRAPVESDQVSASHWPIQKTVEKIAAADEQRAPVESDPVSAEHGPIQTAVEKSDLTDEPSGAIETDLASAGQVPLQSAEHIVAATDEQVAAVEIDAVDDAHSTSTADAMTQLAAEKTPGADDSISGDLMAPMATKNIPREEKLEVDAELVTGDDDVVDRTGPLDIENAAEQLPLGKISTGGEWRSDMAIEAKRKVVGYTEHVDMSASHDPLHSDVHDRRGSYSKQAAGALLTDEIEESPGLTTIPGMQHKGGASESNRLESDFGDDTTRLFDCDVGSDSNIFEIAGGSPGLLNTDEPDIPRPSIFGSFRSLLSGLSESESEIGRQCHGKDPDSTDDSILPHAPGNSKPTPPRESRRVSILENFSQLLAPARSQSLSSQEILEMEKERQKAIVAAHLKLDEEDIRQSEEIQGKMIEKSIELNRQISQISEVSEVSSGEQSETPDARLQQPSAFQRMGEDRGNEVQPRAEEEKVNSMLVAEALQTPTTDVAAAPQYQDTQASEVDKGNSINDLSLTTKERLEKAQPCEAESSGGSISPTPAHLPGSVHSTLNQDVKSQEVAGGLAKKEYPFQSPLVVAATPLVEDMEPKSTGQGVTINEESPFAGEATEDAKPAFAINKNDFLVPAPSEMPSVGNASVPLRKNLDKGVIMADAVPISGEGIQVDQPPVAASKHSSIVSAMSGVTAVDVAPTPLRQDIQLKRIEQDTAKFDEPAISAEFAQPAVPEVKRKSEASNSGRSPALNAAPLVGLQDSRPMEDAETVIMIRSTSKPQPLISDVNQGSATSMAHEVLAKHPTPAPTDSMGENFVPIGEMQLITNDQDENARTERHDANAPSMIDEEPFIADNAKSLHGEILENDNHRTVGSLEVAGSVSNYQGDDVREGVALHESSTPKIVASKDSQPSPDARHRDPSGILVGNFGKDESKHIKEVNIESLALVTGQDESEINVAPNMPLAQQEEREEMWDETHELRESIVSQGEFVKVLEDVGSDGEADTLIQSVADEEHAVIDLSSHLTMDLDDALPVEIKTKRREVSQDEISYDANDLLATVDNVKVRTKRREVSQDEISCDANDLLATDDNVEARTKRSEVSQGEISCDENDLLASDDNVEVRTKRSEVSQDEISCDENDLLASDDNVEVRTKRREVSNDEISCDENDLLASDDNVEVRTKRREVSNDEISYDENDLLATDNNVATKEGQRPRFGYDRGFTERLSFREVSKPKKAKKDTRRKADRKRSSKDKRDQNLPKLLEKHESKGESRSARREAERQRIRAKMLELKSSINELEGHVQERRRR